MTGHSTSGDDPARFLHELRQLRNGAGLGHAELAARAHYPYDSIKAAEVGPSLPDFPVLSAFVRACGGTTEEWEERWRSLTRSPSLPVPAARTAGLSAAASAGARIGAVTHEAENPDPSLILAALNRVAEEMASASPAGELGAGSGAGSWAGRPAEASPTTPAASADPAKPDGAGPDDPLGEGTRPGWDPIRVSTAWPAIPDSVGDNSARDAKGNGSASGRGGRSRRGAASARGTAPAPVAAEASPAADTPAPWGTARWAADPDDAPQSAAPAAGRPGWAKRDAQATAPAPAGRGPAPAASRARIVVVALVLLCVLAVLLAIFV